MAVAEEKPTTNQQDPAPAPSEAKAGKPRRYVKQSDVPGIGITEALRIPTAISDEYGKEPTAPLDIAAALHLQPSSGQFRALAGAALAYGLTDGGPRSDLIGLTELGRRVVAPTEEGDDIAALREAFQRPRVIREFLEKYDGSPLPSTEIGRNVLEQMGVAAHATERVFELIVEGADELGLLRDINGRKYAQLKGARLRALPAPAEAPLAEVPMDPRPQADGPPIDSPPPAPLAVTEPEAEINRVFISHGSNKKIVAQLKDMLTYGGFEPFVSVETETIAKPIPKKVFDEMRSCTAGIIHVANEKTITDRDGTEHHLLNDNVLTEIGGAMALWGENYILLVEEGTKLPSNLQGLYEVRYQGTTLDADATMRLLRAFNSFKG